MIDAFESCLAFTLAPDDEGGFYDDPRGGPTNRGITLPTLSHWLGHPATEADVQALTEDDVRPIYKALYWNAMQCWSLPAGVNVMVFDGGVMSGPKRSALWLQPIVNAKVDGIIGPVTCLAARGAGAKVIIPALYEAQTAFYKQIAHSEDVINGWQARCDRRYALALSMAGLPPAAQGPAP